MDLDSLQQAKVSQGSANFAKTSLIFVSEHPGDTTGGGHTGLTVHPSYLGNNEGNDGADRHVARYTNVTRQC